MSPVERLKRVMTLLIKVVLESMMGYVALNSTMQKVRTIVIFLRLPHLILSAVARRGSWQEQAR